MAKSVLISIRPQWVEKIFNGSKTIEVRRTFPKQLETPFKVYVYCTKERMTRVPSMYAYLHKNERGACAEYGTIETWGKIGDVIVNPHLASKHVSFGMHGKVIGSFVCDKIDEYEANERGWYIYPQDETCLLCDEIAHYGKGKPLYGWHITEPQLFEKPRDITEFAIFGKCADECSEYDFCARDIAEDRVACKCFKRTFLKRPTRSWCYVEGE